jgi:hypothetical protein
MTDTAYEDLHEFLRNSLNIRRSQNVCNKICRRERKACLRPMLFSHKSYDLRGDKIKTGEGATTVAISVNFPFEFNSTQLYFATTEILKRLGKPRQKNCR